LIHIDVKYLPPLNRRRSYAYVAIDRATRFVYLEILPDRRAQTAAGFLNRLLDRFALAVHRCEFTDRFAVDKKDKLTTNPRATIPSIGWAPSASLSTASPARFGRRPTPWSSVSTAASVTTSTACRKTARPPPPVSRPCRTRCRSQQLCRRLQSHPPAMPRLSSTCRTPR
jgi:hypothetical protein